MIANNHLLYIDITTKCGLGCDYCMYGSYSYDGFNLCLSDVGFSQLEGLINHPEVKHVIISGEGEPFKAFNILEQILNLSKGGNYFQIITNGYWVNDDKFVKDFFDFISLKNDKISIRFSLDSFHWKRLQLDHYSKILKFIRHLSPPNVSIAFRSLIEEKNETRKFIFDLIGIIPEPTSVLDDAIYINEKEINITYKNLVYPNEPSSNFNMFTYIDLLSAKYNKEFTFGNLATNQKRTGLDITIKPSGRVYFYGADNKHYCNLNNNLVKISTLQSIIQETSLLKTLYTVPFVKILEDIRCPKIDKLIQTVNNPYWFIRSLPDEYILKIEKHYESD